MKQTILERISKLEIKDYGHDDYALEIVEHINDIVKIANVKGKQKIDLENEVILLLEEFRFG